MTQDPAFKNRSFSVGLSFAGEQRDYVEAVALGLKARGVDVFYDAFHEVQLWGCNLVDTLDDLYSERMSAVIMFISKEYVEKPYTDVERQAALAKAIRTRQKYIYPVRFDGVKLPGLPSTVSYLEASRNTPEQLSAKICQAIGATSDLKESQVGCPYNHAEKGRLIFSQASFDGRAQIGAGICTFDVKTSACGADGIYLYNDPSSIKGIAVAHDVDTPDAISDASKLDFTSRSRAVRCGQVAVLKNKDGFFAAFKLIDVKDRSRGGDDDRVEIEYVILSEGGSDFSKVTK